MSWSPQSAATIAATDAAGAASNVQAVLDGLGAITVPQVTTAVVSYRTAGGPIIPPTPWGGGGYDLDEWIVASLVVDGPDTGLFSMPDLGGGYGMVQLTADAVVIVRRTLEVEGDVAEIGLAWGMFGAPVVPLASTGAAAIGAVTSTSFAEVLAAATPISMSAFSYAATDLDIRAATTIEVSAWRVPT